jgi:hypothetical protein
LRHRRTAAYIGKIPIQPAVNTIADVLPDVMDTRVWWDVDWWDVDMAGQNGVGPNG